MLANPSCPSSQNLLITGSFIMKNRWKKLSRKNCVTFTSGSEFSFLFLKTLRVLPVGWRGMTRARVLWSAVISIPGSGWLFCFWNANSPEECKTAQAWNQVVFSSRRYGSCYLSSEFHSFVRSFIHPSIHSFVCSFYKCFLMTPRYKLLSHMLQSCTWKTKIIMSPTCK